ALCYLISLVFANTISPPIPSFGEIKGPPPAATTRRKKAIWPSGVFIDTPARIAGPRQRKGRAGGRRRSPSRDCGGVPFPGRRGRRAHFRGFPPPAPGW